MEDYTESFNLLICNKNLICHTWQITTLFKLKHNKKVLLRERKRHTARRVVSTPSVVLTGYPPPGGVPGPDRVPPPGGYPDLDLTGYPPWGGTQSGTPPGGYPDPPGGVPDRVPPPGGYPDLDLTGSPPGGVPGPGPDWVPPRGGYPDPPHCLMAFWEMLQSIMGYGYPPRCGQTNKVKLLPSRRTTYAGGNNARWQH